MGAPALPRAVLPQSGCGPRRSVTTQAHDAPGLSAGGQRGVGAYPWLVPGSLDDAGSVNQDFHSPLHQTQMNACCALGAGCRGPLAS